MVISSKNNNYLVSSVDSWDIGRAHAHIEREGKQHSYTNLTQPENAIDVENLDTSLETVL